MTILFFSRLFYPHIGGVEKHVNRISQELIKQGHKIIVVTENHGWKEKEVIEGIEIIRVPVGKSEKQKKFVIWSWLLNHRELIEQADVIHCHDVFFWYLPFRFLYPNKKVFVTFHGYEGNTIPGKKAILMHKLAEKLTYGNICIGEFLTKWYHTKPSVISYGGVDIPQKNIASKQTKLLHFLYIGRLEEEAGIIEYIKALGILAQKHIDTKLTILGDGSQKKQAQELALKLHVNVQFKGFVENVEQYLPGSTFVFVSRYLGILEALAYKKLVFAIYNTNIKKDYLTLTPFVDWIEIVKNPEELVRQILHTIDNPKRQKTKIEKASSWVKNQTWNMLANEYLNVWMKS